MTVMANGLNSRDKSRLAIRSMQQIPRQDENFMALTPFVPSDEDVDFRPHVSRDMVRIPGSKRSNARLDFFSLYFQFGNSLNIYRNLGLWQIVAL